MELDRLENKIRSLSEIAVNRQEPEYISSEVDHVASSMLDTEKTMNELQFATGLTPTDSETPESCGEARLFRGRYSVHSTQYTVLSTQYTVHSTQYSVLSTQYSVPGTQYSDVSVNILSAVANCSVGQSSLFRSRTPMARRTESACHTPLTAF